MTKQTKKIVPVHKIVLGKDAGTDQIVSLVWTEDDVMVCYGETQHSQYITLTYHEALDMLPMDGQTEAFSHKLYASSCPRRYGGVDSDNAWTCLTAIASAANSSISSLKHVKTRVGSQGCGWLSEVTIDHQIVTILEQSWDSCQALFKEMVTNEARASKYAEDAVNRGREIVDGRIRELKAELAGLEEIKKKQGDGRPDIYG